MAYASIGDVQARMPQFVLSPTSKPTIEAAQVFLDDTHAQFDAAMSNLGYVIPITGPNSVAQARELVSQGTIAKILYARGAALGGDAAFQSADRAQKMYQDGLLHLADPKYPIELTDAERVWDTEQKTIAIVSGLVVDAEGSNIEPRISMDSRVGPMRDF